MHASKLWTKTKSHTFNIASTSIFILTPFVLAMIAKEKMSAIEQFQAEQAAHAQQNPFGAMAPDAVAPANPMAGGGDAAAGAPQRS